MSSPTRRRFAQAAAFTAASYARIQGASDRIRLGFIGVGNRGSNLLSAANEFADQRVAAVCDLVPAYRERAVEAAGSSPDAYEDYRHVLDRNDIDAVVVATPDHWHAIMTVQTCRAGKDVYVEKPLSLTVVEGRKIVDVARQANRIVQVGIHRRSSPFCREAAEIVRSGELGHIVAARCGVNRNMYPAGIGAPADAPAPEGVNWDLYLGPAPEAAHNANRHRFNYRWFFDYGGGQLTDNGVHFLDLIHWGLGQETPLAVTAIGGKYAVQDNRETPDTMQVLWQYPQGTLVSFFQSSVNAAPWAARDRLLAEFRGTKGTMYVTFGGWEIVPESNSPLAAPPSNPLDREAGRRYRDSFRPAMEARSNTGPASPQAHIRNFLDCVQSRAKPNCDVETAHRSTTAANIGLIALKIEQHLAWDAANERFPTNAEANTRLHYDYRPPWSLD